MAHLHEYTKIGPDLRQLLLILPILILPCTRRNTVLHRRHPIRQHLLQHLPGTHIRLGKRRPDALHQRLGELVRLPQRRYGAQGSEGESGVEGIDGLADEVEIVDDDCG